MNNITKKFVRLGTLMMALSVALGAFGAHALKHLLDDQMRAVYHTAVQYQFYHSLGMFVVAFIAHLNIDKKINIAGNLMLFSTIIFSGSLYAMTVTGITTIGIITPIGGVGFVISWIMLFFAMHDIEH